jgi:hypothetical protein
VLTAIGCGSLRRLTQVAQDDAKSSQSSDALTRRKAPLFKRGLAACVSCDRCALLEGGESSLPVGRRRRTVSAKRGPRPIPYLMRAGGAETGRPPRHEGRTGNMSDDTGNAAPRASTSSEKKGGPRARACSRDNRAHGPAGSRQYARGPAQVTVGDLASEFESSPPAEPAGAQVGLGGRVAGSCLTGRVWRVNFAPLGRAGDDAAGTVGRGCAEPGAPA